VIARYSREPMSRLWSDQYRLDRWMEVEILAVEAYERLGTFPTGTAARIRAAAHVSPERVLELEQRYRHDVIAFLGAMGESLQPEDSRTLHFGLTSTDVVDTAQASILKDAVDLLLVDLERVRDALARLAVRYRDTPIMGRTHGIHAEPTTFGLKMALYWAEFGRHRERLAAARAAVAVGKISGAVGTYANVPPAVEAYVTDKLGLTAAPISNQVLQRDRHAELVTTLALIATSIDKWATEVRHLQRTEVGEAAEPFGTGQRGSSAMPHKRNPVACEQLSGLARVLRGYVVPALEDMVLWHERDISHSSVERIMLPDVTILADYMLHNMARIVDGLDVYPDRMRTNLERGGGVAFSGKVLLALVEHGLSRDQAYDAVQKAAHEVMAGHAESFRARIEDDPAAGGRLDAGEWDALFDLAPYLEQTRAIFARLGLETDVAAASH
jgi:adenylosuccinate lyase